MMTTAATRIMMTLALLFSATSALADEPAKEAPQRGPGTERDEECLVCHAGIGEEEAPKLDMPLYERSAHGKEGCISCHPDVEDESLKHEEEDQDLAPAVCADCHAEPKEAYGNSRHADPKAAKDAELDQATCASCHGGHDVLPPTDPKSRTHPIQQLQTCGQCHGTHRVAAGHNFEVPEEHKEVVESEDVKQIEALIASGELIRAACSDCHGPHDIRPSTDLGSTLHPSQVLQTCGECHQDQRDAFEGSAHAAAAKKEGFAWDTTDPEQAMNDAEQPPTCATCHRMHDGAAPQTDAFRLDLVEECGTCHEPLMKTYQESYHGKATLLGQASIAKCSDCHGFHGILGVDDPKSPINPQNKLQTCQECHDGAPPRFAEFWAHPDHHDSENFPVLFWVFVFMTTLLVSVFSFFALHTLLWAIREGIDAVKEGGFLPKHTHTGPRVSRFNAFDRFVHLLVVISFLGLAATGAPLKFAGASWAKAVFVLFGGVEGAATLHHIFAVVTFIYFALHLGSLARRFWGFKKQGILLQKLIGPDSLVPSIADIKDVFANFKWFFGAGPQPTWDKWTYWEKFDYWAVFWGVAIIGSSGLVLWFPAFFTHVLPGWMVNVALVVHSDEALLAMGFIFGVHFFNGHLRRAKFPMDEVMFTGSVPISEYQHERGREWARMQAEGQVEARHADAPDPRFRIVARIFGVAAWLTGLIILGLIMHGFLTT